MIDREKVVERLEKVSYYFKSLLAVGWQGDADIYREHRESVNMAIALLKEQEAEQPIVHENSYGWKFYYCPKCKQEFYQNRKQAYCDKCGQKVKWDDKE